MTGFVVVDVETAPLKATDPAVIDYLIRKSFSLDFHPFFAKLVCAGVKSEDDDPAIASGDDEADVLKTFWGELDALAPSPAKPIVTFNGYQFDVPFLYVRSWFNGIKPKVDINLNKWNMEKSNHFDCMQGLSVKGTIQWVSLEITCRLFNITIPEGKTRADRIFDLYLAGDWEAIKAHNRHDLELTEQLFKKARPLFY